MATDNFSTLFDLLPLGAYQCSPDGRLLRANAALVRLTGFASERQLLDMVTDLGTQWYVEPQRRSEFMARLKTDGRVSNFESEVFHQTKPHKMWVREHAHLVRDALGAPLLYEGTIEDITSQQLAQHQLSDSAALFLAVVNTVPDLVWLKDAEGIYQACNSAFERHFGAASSHIVGKTDADFATNEIGLRLARTDESTLHTGQTAAFEEELPLTGNSGFGTFEIIKAPMRNALGQIIGELGMARDITDRKHAETQLRNLSEQFELALISAELGMWIQHLAPATEAAYELDARARAVLGLSADPADDAPGWNSWTHWVHPEDLPAAKAEMKRHLGGQIPFFEAEYRARHKDGRYIWVSSRGKVVQTNTKGEPVKVVGTLMDIHGRKGAEEAIRQMAFQDSLTGLPNRRLLLDRLEQALAVSARRKRCGALLFLDLDKFKDLNDSRGHDVGDLLLQQVAQRIQQSVRAVDTVARIGGDEFVVLVADLSESAEYAKSNALKVGQKILQALNAPYALGSYQHTSTPSIGATIFEGLQHTPAEVLRQADMAMYEAKAKGRNMLRFFDPVPSALIG